MTSEIFLSVGRTYRPEQETFVDAFEDYLRAQGLTPFTLGRNFWSDKQPLIAISEKMDECVGTAILAFERTRIAQGYDKPDSDDQSPLEGLGLPTVWNQIEAALAYSRGHPLLVVVQDHLKHEGLLEHGYDWYVKKVPLTPEAFTDREFIGVVGSWAQAVKQRTPQNSAIATGAAAPVAAITDDEKPTSPPVEIAPTAPDTQTSTVPEVQPASSPLGSAGDPTDTPTAADLEVDPAGLIRVLFLAANPAATSRLRLDEEHREIDLALQRAKNRDRFKLETVQALRVSDLQERLLRFEPHIVHFSGHGSDQGELLLEDASGQVSRVSERALSSLFKVLRNNIRCVVLNACYSQTQAEAIAEHIDCVIGMSTAIGDRAAIAFSAAFYQALAYASDVEKAFQLGLVQIDLDSLGEEGTPRLLAPNSDPSTIVFT